MGHVQPRHRKVIDGHLQSGETVQAIMHTQQGKETPPRAFRQFTADHGIVFRGVAGVVDLFDTWLVLTDRRLAFFKGSWFTLRPGPTRHILDMPPDRFTLRWRPEKEAKDYWLIDLVFPDDEHLVVMAEPDEDSRAFIDAVGGRAERI